MARRNKQKKFNEVLSFPNVVENYDAKEPKLFISKDEEIVLNGKWKSDFFKKDVPLTLELACGRGEYSLQLGRRYPERSFLGVDIKGARIWQGAKNALADELDNVKFLRTRIEQIERFFGTEEVDEIWITFPDPFLGKENRRLTSPPFLERYKLFLNKDHIIHLKTDDDTLYEYSMEVLSNRPDTTILYHNNDIYAGDLYLDELSFKTYYEAQHLANGKKIKYIQFKLDITD